MAEKAPAGDPAPAGPADRTAEAPDSVEMSGRVIGKAPPQGRR